MEVENRYLWKVTTIGGTQFWLLWLWEEVYQVYKMFGSNLSSFAGPFCIKPKYLGWAYLVGAQGPNRILAAIFGGSPGFSSCLA